MTRVRRAPTRLLILTLVTSLAACRAAHRPAAPAAGTSPPAAPRAVNPRVFAVDGHCSDELVRYHVGMTRLHGLILGTLQMRRREFRRAIGRAKHSHFWPTRARADRAAGRLRETYGGWLGLRQAYDRRFGPYACLRRDTLEWYDARDFDRGIAEIHETVRWLGPLPDPVPHELD